MKIKINKAKNLADLKDKNWINAPEDKKRKKDKRKYSLRKDSCHGTPRILGLIQ